MNPNLTFCDLDEPNTILAKMIFALANQSNVVVTKKDWRKLVDTWACSHGFDGFYTTDGGKFIQTISNKQIIKNAVEMRQRQAIPYNGEWHKVQIID